MYKKLKLIIIVSIIFTSSSYSQRYQIYEGAFENLSNINSFKVEFNYENIQVNGFESEEDFLKEKMEKRKANPEKAENFRRDWFSNRDEYYNPAFIKYFNNYFKKGERKIVVDSQYLMKVNLTWIYPGYAIEPAKLSATIDFIDTTNSKKLLVIHFEKVIGIEKKTIEVNEYERVTGAFEKLAKNLAIQLK
ncbi:hypothetical protein IRZ71_22780 [Flavobacterium sp. ANB]|uniref:hypothetical protein n=1 Tax=unclassified Flavobacterium TaxID=196869 RepID=UPI0012B95BB3|nr:MULTISPECIES: hypothetical protein [unclassified Flavobacterium]MBF4519187.1 hypothetical protein [Flavobacterium sp. ANB]MTD72009.1 hypothetical protein [Flavobacterium sp. LC2016-13]